MFKLVISLDFALISATSSLAAPELTPGKVFPDLKLPVISGESSLSIKEFHGKKVMLHVFASW